MTVFPPCIPGQGGGIRRWISGMASIILLVAAGVAPANNAGLETGTTVDVCYDFTCGTRETVLLDRHALRSVARIFEPPPRDAKDERERIAKAVARMEQLVGLLTPTFRDVGRNYSGTDDHLAGLPGQLDCVDESINTTAYLNLMQDFGWLRFHEAGERAYRQALLTQHWAGSIVDRGTGRTWIVDSWFGDNGDPPYVVPGDDWHDLSVFRRRSERETKKDVAIRDRAR